MASLQTLGIETLTLDVTKADSISGLRKQIEELTGGKLNILINNACVSPIYFGLIHRANHSLLRGMSTSDVPLFTIFASHG